MSVEASEVAEHVFVGVPAAGAVAEDLLPRWIEAVDRERSVKAAAGWCIAERVHTIHVGGAPASSLGADAPRLVLDAVASGMAPFEELAVEALPAQISTDVSAGWERAGVTRVALRGGAEGEVREAALRLRASRIRSWGVELGFGTPGETVETALRRLGSLLETGPDHVSLAEGERSGDPDRVADIYLALGDALEAAGYPACELTSFARPGHASRHLGAVLRGCPYLGLGPGAHSFDGLRRSWNLSDANAYFSRVRRGADPTAGIERPTARERFLETVWMGLRTSEGLVFADLPPGALSLHERWTSLGWARGESDRLRLTRRGWLLLDTLAAELAGLG